MSWRVIIPWVLLGLSGPAWAGGVDEAEVALQSGDVDAAIRTLKKAFVAGEVKRKDRALGQVLLGESLLTQADALTYQGQGGPQLRDLRLDALAAGHAAKMAEPDESLGFRAEAVIRRARALLWDQGHTVAHSGEGASVKGWFRGLESREGETLESLSLRAMDLAASGDRTGAAHAFGAATQTADQEGSVITTPRWGLTYLDEANNLLALRPDAGGEAVGVLERGLSWHVRASTVLDREHELALEELRGRLERARTDLLLTLPDRRTEALYAVEAALREHPKDLGRLSQVGPWLEQHVPDRALNAYVNAQSAVPADPRPLAWAGGLLVRRAEQTYAERRGVRDAVRREELARLREGQLRDAKRYLEQAYEKDARQPQVCADLVSVHRALGDWPGVKTWQARAKAANGEGLAP